MARVLVVSCLKLEVEGALCRDACWKPGLMLCWVVGRLFGRVSTRKSSDMGIDGYTFEGYPIQVKQSKRIGRNVVDNFETAMRRKKASKGVIVAFSFGKGAYEEVARAKLHDNLDIRAITIKEMLVNQKQRKLLSSNVSN